MATQPTITGTVSKEPVSSGQAIRPFATVSITDTSSATVQDTATIKIIDDDSKVLSDADGLLTGAGLSKIGIGTYTVEASSPEQLRYYLDHLLYSTVTLGTGQTKTADFELDVANSANSTTDTTTSVLIEGLPKQPVPPQFVGTQTGQTVAPGNIIDPFNSVSLTDTNTSPQDTVTITTVDASGNPTDSNGTFNFEPWLTKTGTGTYSLAAASPTTITSELNQMVFSPTSSGTTPLTTQFKLAATDTTVNQSTTDNNTTVIKKNPIIPGPTVGNNFSVNDETNGQVYSIAGQSYSGPVSGITSELVMITSDNVNISSEAPNVFIHSGSGNDALNVSAGNGTNVLDGSTGSNFMVGGTGDDTFFVDDRGPSSDIWTTVSGFHAGDAATVFGVTPNDFSLNWVDGQGATGYTGLTLHATASGKPTASLTLAGFSSTDLTNGKLVITYGNETDGTPYMLIQGR